MPDVVERSGEVAGLRTCWREAPADGRPPILYVHGVPTASWDWIPYLERIGGVAPDLPGLGRSAKPPRFDYSIAGFDRWLESFTEMVGLERFSLVVHDWGGLALALAQRFPERVERLVLHTCTPLLPGYRWHWIARIWRTPIVGELFMATSTKSGFKQISRQANVTPEVLARAGRRLAELRCPALILWPTDDPYIGPEWGQRYAQALGGDVRLETIERAGHWTWLDRPDVIDMAAEFLDRAH